MARIIVGLGNPGARYARSRHNIGFMVLDALAREASGEWSALMSCLACRMEISGRPVLLAKPLTYMNNSGEAVRALLTALQRGAQDLLLVLDDLNLPFGRIRVRERGSAGGHRGLDSVLSLCGTEEIARIRVGIGEEDMPEDKADFVLSDFPPERQQALNELILQAGNAVKSVLRDGIPRTMAVYNA